MSFIRKITDQIPTIGTLWTLAFAAIFLGSSPGALVAEEPATRCVLVEFYYRSTTPSDVAAVEHLQKFQAKHPGLHFALRDLVGNDKNQSRLEQLAEHFKFNSTEVPVLYSCNRVMYSPASGQSWSSLLESTLQFDVYTRAGCSRCQAAKEYLVTLLKRYPALKVRYREITTDRLARQDLDSLVIKFKSAATSTPVFHLFDTLVVGFESSNSSGPRLEKSLKKWTIDCPPNKPTEPAVQNLRSRDNKVSEVTDFAPF
jgi:glutaredoxin